MAAKTQVSSKRHDLHVLLAADGCKEELAEVAAVFYYRGYVLCKDDMSGEGRGGSGPLFTLVTPRFVMYEGL